MAASTFYFFFSRKDNATEAKIKNNFSYFAFLRPILHVFHLRHPQKNYLCNMETKLEIYSADLSTQLNLLYADDGIRAGFPSPAQDYTTEAIDLNKELIRHPATTFYAKAVGDSMKDRGIDDGDLLVIDKSIEPEDGDIVVAYIDGEFTLKTVKTDPQNECVWLVPANRNYPPIKVTEDNSFLIWGVLTSNIKKQFRKL